MNEALGDGEFHLAAVNIGMKRVENNSRRDEAFKIGDELVLSTKNLRQMDSHLPTELCRHWVEPFTLEKVVSPVAYRPSLPQDGGYGRPSTLVT